MKKLILIVLLVIVATAIVLYVLIFTGNTNFDDKKKYLYIPSGEANYGYLLKALTDSQFIKNPAVFDFWAKRRDLPAHVQPGKYAISHGASIHEIVRMLVNGTQEPVNLVINKVRTKAQLAYLIGRRLECDSASVMSFLNDPEKAAAYGVDTLTALTLVLPDTYTYYWNSTPEQVFDKIRENHRRFWNEERTAAAAARSLTPATAYILASIVEEETNANDEKDTIASVYLNRLKKNHKLQADPTVKYALQDFSLRRILHKHLRADSPYNTYMYTGLPPGPICTPAVITIEKVLASPETKYMYFVAKADFSGRHTFAVTYKEHLDNAKLFHQALNARTAAQKDTTNAKN